MYHHEGSPWASVESAWVARQGFFLGVWSQGRVDHMSWQDRLKSHLAVGCVCIKPFPLCSQLSTYRSWKCCDVVEKMKMFHNWARPTSFVHHLNSEFQANVIQREIISSEDEPLDPEYKGM